MSPAAKNNGNETSICPWCSATVPADTATCPACGASLRDAADGEILGVTHVDPSAASKLKRLKADSIATFLGVSDGPDLGEVPGGKVEPPSDEVRREMLRLRLAALDAEIEAKAKEVEAQRALPPADPPGTTSG